MNRNIIQILKAGNQELFYSSFIAWLLDKNGEHGLKDQFSTWFINKIGISSDEIINIKTEEPINAGRADIYLVTKNELRIIIENKTKTIGTLEQLDNYQKNVDIIVPLGFTEVNFEDLLSKYSIITYSEILEYLHTCILYEQKFTVLTKQFIEFLDYALIPLNLLNDFCNNKLELTLLLDKLQSIADITQNKNDIRFFQAIYLLRLKKYLVDNLPCLTFSNFNDYYVEKKHQDKPVSTSWLVKKNMQSGTFMEAIIYTHEIIGKLKLREKWKPSYDSVLNHDLSPRIEVKINPKDIITNDNAGVFLLGTFDKDFNNVFTNSGLFTTRGQRNFHYRILKINDLKYQKISAIIIEEMNKVWEFV